MIELMAETEKLNEFKSVSITLKETVAVKTGVECDIYAFKNDPSKDLGIIRVSKGSKTPLQKVLAGNQTIEGYLEGAGTLTIGSADGKDRTYSYPGETDGEITVKIGEIMQWTAAEDTDLTFYEICNPPYQEGRFYNLEE